MVKARSEREIEKLALKFFPNRFSLAPLSQKKSFLIDTSAPVTIRAHRDRALDGNELSLWRKGSNRLQRSQLGAFLFSFGHLGIFLINDSISGLGPDIMMMNYLMLKT